MPPARADSADPVKTGNDSAGESSLYVTTRRAAWSAHRGPRRAGISGSSGSGSPGRPLEVTLCNLHLIAAPATANQRIVATPSVVEYDIDIGSLNKVSWAPGCGDVVRTFRR
jgi:hypothetical protein